MEMKTKDLWVIVETEENGAAKKVGIELLTPGKELAAKQGGALVAVVIGSGVDAAVADANAYGADKIIVVDAPEYAKYTTDAYATALGTLIEKYGPATVLFGTSDDARDVAPRLAARFETGLIADCTALEMDENGKIAFTRPVFGGKMFSTVVCEQYPQMATVRSGVFKKGEAVDGTAEIVKEEIAVAADQIRTQVLDMIRDMGEEKIDLEGAEVIVAGGRGVGGEEGFKLLRELADLLGGTLGATRAAIDGGWISRAYQIGQSGKNVSPKLYIGCGISGAAQHTSGITGSDVIVAINKDEDAPIFEIADYAVVGNLFDVVPVLIEEIKKSRA